MNRKDPPDEGKIGYEFWESVGELPVIKQIKDWNEASAQKSEYLNERARSGKEGLLVQGMQAVQDTLGTVVGLPFQALEAGIQEASDRTNIDARTFGAIKDIISYSKSVKASKSGSFYKGVQVAKKNIPRADILNPGQITVKPITPEQGSGTINKVWGFSRFKHSKLPSPIQTAQRRLDIIQGEGGTLGQNLQMKQEPKVSTNEKVKQALIANDVIELPPTYKGGPVTFREEADFFDVSAALIGGGLEDTVDASGKKIDYNRDAVTKFHTKSEKKDIVFNHIKDRLRGTTITRKEFNEYAKEQIAAEKDLRKAIKLLNLKEYASQKGIDLSKYPTIDSQLELLNNINKAKRPPHRKKNKDTGEFTEGLETFEARTKIWEMDTDRFQQYTDYKETFDYGHIISAKTGFRLEDLGLNRISNTEIEVAHDVVSRDPRTQKMIEILQEGNRERGSRRDYHPAIQRMRNTAGSVVEDFVKWKANKDDDPVNLTKILDKFIPRDQHDNYLQFIQKKFYEKRSLGFATKKEFVEEVYGFPYKLYENIPNSQKVKINKEFTAQKKAMGNIIGKQQYDQAGEWMLDAIDEFIGLHHFSKSKYLKKDAKQLKDLDDLPKNIDDLMDMILPDR